MILLFKPMLDFGASAGGAHITQMAVDPIATRTTGSGGENADLITCVQLKIQRHNAAIDLSAATTMPNFSMHVIGKINWRGFKWQIYNMAFGREHIHALIGHALTNLCGQFLRVAIV